MWSALMSSSEHVAIAPCFCCNLCMCVRVSVTSARHIVGARCLVLGGGINRSI